MFVWKKSTSFVQLSAQARLDSFGYFASIVIIFASRRCVASGDFSIRAQQRTRRAEGQPGHADFPRVRLQNLDGELRAIHGNADGMQRKRLPYWGGRGKELYFLYPYSGRSFTYPTSTPTSCSFKIIGISRASSGVCVTRYSRTFGPILRIDSITSTI